MIASKALPLVALLCVVAACGSPTQEPTSGGESSRPAAAPTSAPGEGPLVVPTGAEAAVPAQVEIASVGIRSGLDRLGSAADGEVEAPPRWQVAGWYAGGSRPGETGPAVIAGHVDSPDGPAVFAALPQVQVGDRVTVTDVDGVVHRFRVDRTETAPRDQFPTRAVYGPTPDAQLRLITCDGPYVAAAGGYQDNFIVYATKVPS